MALLDTLKQIEEQRQKSIPSKVFFNHFYAVNVHIQSNIDKYNLKKISFFNSLTLKNPTLDVDVIRKLLWNSWSTEYAFLLANQLDNDDYYRFSLHWNFPQAYYSVYLTMTAFHETQNVANEQHEKSIKIFGSSIKDNHYPSALSFYAAGMHNEFKFSGLQDFEHFPKDFNGLARVNSTIDAKIQIASFLKSTRKKIAENKREKLEIAKDKRFFNKKGLFTQKFSAEHWNHIYKTIPETTILNLLYRLRIKANYHDVESFINAEIDFKAFHESLGGIIDYLNFLHEAYIVKVIGIRAYEEILNKFPHKMNTETALKRYNERIKSLLVLK